MDYEQRRHRFVYSDKWSLLLDSLLYPDRLLTVADKRNVSAFERVGSYRVNMRVRDWNVVLDIERHSFQVKYLQISNTLGGERILCEVLSDEEMAPRDDLFVFSPRPGSYVTRYVRVPLDLRGAPLGPWLE